MSNTNACSKGPNRDVSTEPSHTWANLLRKGASLSRGRLRGWAISLVRDFAHPLYDCEDCIGMKNYGCQCRYYGCAEPGRAPGRIRRLAQWLFERMTR